MLPHSAPKKPTDALIIVTGVEGVLKIRLANALPDSPDQLAPLKTAALFTPIHSWGNLQLKIPLRGFWR